ncbi:TPA: TonB-dependent siderophore receptor [Pseudomonas putida]|uniref:TonB-dependent siderophore receptor n=1 Tax=Pseudomonas putida (strain GB-1) TaxID=76869 RepID=B0KLI9_PSEPG|nr:TonB-dependent receptor [Pseudomonas putida]MBP0709841.1 TonB-dependent siderophore receptor [Pseudomonas sp. T34]MCE1002823.1 TonB-dependent receptor [Pseudomonas sp. NMI1173_11]MCK2189288.1 TonB-dependent receptor [Pseudomonas sp. MB04B]NOG88557.1 TonB-dependent siderophore receptor [Pseudomonas sp. SbB1]ABY97966.1 TonB-dependent siderophore receptor [Pseudomonas putida GB-1]
MYNPLPRALPLVAALASFNVLAQAQTQMFDLPPASLAQTLNRIASQSGHIIALEPALVRGKQAPAVVGQMSAEQAMQAALAGSGLQLRVSSEGHFSVAPASLGGDVMELGSTSITDNYVDATSEGTGSYAARAVTLGKGTHTLKEIPQSVTVITRKQLDDQGITDLQDALNHTTGIVGAQGIGPGVVVTSRGFQIDDWQYDGVPIPRNNYSLGNWATQDLVFFDRVEILRGASGLLQGTGSPGGAINLVRKRGQATPTVTLTGKAGSWDHYGLQLDAGGPLTADGRVRGRLVADEDQSDSFIDYQWSKSHSLYGALDIDLNDATTVGAGISYNRQQSRPMLRGIPRYATGKPVDVPRSTYTGARWSRAETDVTTYYLDLEHRFNEDWAFKAAAVRMDETNTSTHQRTQTVGEGLEPDGSGVEYADWITDFHSTKLGLDMNVVGHFDTGPVAHEVTFGGNYSKLTSDDGYWRTFGGNDSIFDIDHDRPEPSRDSLLAAPFGRHESSGYDIRQKGLYGAWRVKPTDRLTLILGSRVSWFDYSYASTTYRGLNPGQVNPTSRMTETGEVTPYAGFVYDLTREWAWYASYTDVFVPQTERAVGNTPLKPVIGSNYETGLKGELLDGRVNASIALFRYDQENRAVTDTTSGFACDDWYCSTASGKVRSQGVEAEISGEVLSGLQLFAGYTYNTTKFLEDPVDKGRTFSQWTPKHMLRAWADYTLPLDGQRWSTGLGFTTQSHTLGYERTYTVPGYTVWSARLAYQLTPEVNVAVNANNLFDKKYWVAGFNQLNGSNNYGEPRNFLLTVKYTPEL